MSRARDTANTQDNVGGAVTPIVGGKNAIINGGMDIWQRGTTLSSTSGLLSTAYLADRWSTYYYGGGNTANYTVSQQAMTPGSLTGYEPQYYMRNAFPAGNAGTYWELINKIEDVRTYAGQTIVISFWLRNSSTSVAPSMEIIQNFGTGGSSSVYYYPATTTISSSWTKYTVSTTLGSISGKTIGTGSYLQFKLYFGPSAGSVTAFNFDIVGFQMELGSVATPFSRAGGTLQGELAACQRYYWRAGGDSLYQAFGIGSSYSTTQAVIVIPYPVPMRDTPTTIDYNALGIKGNPSWTPVAVTSANNFNGTSGSKYVMNLYTVSNSLTSGNYYTLVANNSTAAYLGFGAEL